VTRSNSDLVIRPAHPRDAVPLARELAAQIAASPYYTEEMKAAETARMSAAVIEEIITIDPDFVLVGEISGEIVGAEICSPDNGILWVQWAYVREDARKGGTGMRIGRRMNARFQNTWFTKMCCYTRTENRESNAITRLMGFRIVTELKNHWFGQDYYYWERPLCDHPPAFRTDLTLPLAKRAEIRLRHAIRARVGKQA
jgi:hypothetical protein